MKKFLATLKEPRYGKTTVLLGTIHAAGIMLSAGFSVGTLLAITQHVPIRPVNIYMLLIGTLLSVLTLPNPIVFVNIKIVGNVELPESSQGLLQAPERKVH